MINDSHIASEVIDYFTDKIELDLYRFDSHLHDCYSVEGKEDVVQKIKDIIKAIQDIHDIKIG